MMMLKTKTVRIAALIVVAAFLMACNRSETHHHTAEADPAERVTESHAHDHHDSHDHQDHAAHEEHHHEALAAAEPLHDHSVFHVDSIWRDQDDQAFPWQSLQGRPTVVVMFFATCNTACPLLVNDVRRLEAALPDHVADDLQVVFVSFDTARDTPERLREYGDERGIDFTKWSLLHGNDAQIRELAAVLGVRYRKTAEGDFMHSNVVTVLDREGRILHREEGLGKDIEPAVRKLVGKG